MIVTKIKNFLKKLLSSESPSLLEVVDKHKNTYQINDAIIKEIFTALNKPGCAIYIAASGYDSSNGELNIISANIEENSIQESLKSTIF